MPNWKQIGEYGQYIMFAETYGWLPSQVDEQDAEIMGELMAYLRAKSAVEEKHRNRKK